MNVSEIIEEMLRESKKSKRYLAQRMGITPQAIAMMLRRGNATISTLCEVCDILEYEITIQPLRTRGARPAGQMVVTSSKNGAAPSEV